MPAMSWLTSARAGAARGGRVLSVFKSPSPGPHLSRVIAQPRPGEACCDPPGRRRPPGRQQVLDTALISCCPAVMAVFADEASVASVEIDGLALAASKLDDRAFRAFIRLLTSPAYWPFASLWEVCSCCLIFVI